MWQMQVLCRQPMVPWVMMKQSVQGSRRQQMQGAQLLLLLLLLAGVQSQARAVHGARTL
jgi:hypothetical protein